MPSERRLHPISIVLGWQGQVRQFLLPWLFGGYTGYTAGLAVDTLFMLLVLPFALVSVWRYFALRYSLDENEIVIRTGVFFRNERHIPYHRIQNLEATQNILHRPFELVELRVETGGGSEPEATLSALPKTDFEDLRRRVFGHRETAEAPTESPGVQSTTSRPLLHLPPQELAICGLIQGRGFVLVAAAFGALVELGLLDGIIESWIGEPKSGSGLIRHLMAAVFGFEGLSLGRIALAMAALFVLFLFVRAIGIAWTLIQLHGFKLTRAGEDLRTEYGLLTKVAKTIPLRRIQTLTIREGPLHRRLGRVSVKAETAGGVAEEEASKSELLAPLLRRDEVPGFVQAVIAEPGFETVEWRRTHPRAFRRALKQWVLVMFLFSLPFVMLLRVWYPALLILFLAWAFVGARKEIQHLGWALTDRAVVFRSGWIWKQISIVQFSKIQSVALRESPFDRRAIMGRVKVDTAGAGQLSHSVEIPYLPRAAAQLLSGRLAHEAAQTAFRW